MLGQNSRVYFLSEFSEFTSAQWQVHIWSNNQAWSLLERFLALSQEAHYSMFLQKRLPRVCSDHFGIFLDYRGTHEGSRYFKFETLWHKVEDFMEKVRLR